MAHDLTIPVEVQFAEGGGDDEKWKVTLRAVNSRRPVQPEKSPEGKRLKFSAKGLESMVPGGAVPLVMGDSHARADANVLNTVGFSEARRVDGDDLVAEAYLLKTSKKAQELWANAQADPNYKAMVGCSIRGSLDIAKDQVRAGSDDHGEYMEFDGGWEWKNIMLLPRNVAAWKDTSVVWSGAEQAVAAAEAALQEEHMLSSESTQETAAAPQAAAETEAPVAGANPNGEELPMDDKEKAGLFQRALAAVASAFSGDVAAAEPTVEPEPEPDAAPEVEVKAIGLSDEDRQAIVDGLYEKLRADATPEPEVEAETEAEPEAEAEAEPEPNELQAQVATLTEQVAALSTAIEGLKGTAPVAGQHPVKPAAPSGKPADEGTPLGRVARTMFKGVPRARAAS